MSVCVVGSDVHCCENGLSGNCSGEARPPALEEAGCGTNFAGRVRTLWCTDPADEEGLCVRRKTRIPIESRPPSRRQRKSGSTDEPQREINLGLPPIERHYERAIRGPGDEDAGFGNGLAKYLHKATRMPRAVMTIPKAAIPLDASAADVERQLALLCRLDHPNIVPFRECCESGQHLKLVYDWCEGGPLMSQLWRLSGVFSEGHLAQVIREMLSALAAAHSFGVHHLDLGLFSLFLQNPDSLSPVRVFGFGLAGFLLPPVPVRKLSRTNKHYYAAPELFAVPRVRAMTLSTRHSCDIWSVGTLLYTLSSGRPPFGIGSITDLSDRVQHNAWSFGLEFGEYSSGLKDLLEKVLCVPWSKRPTADAALRHPWLSKAASITLRNGMVSHVAMKQLSAYVAADHAKQTVARMLTDIGLTMDAYSDLEKKFREVDLNGDGTITLGELVEVASSMPGISQSEVDAIVAKCDRNGNCNVDISEFIAALVMEQEEADERLIRRAFSKMDRNGDARVTKKELFKILRQYSGSMDVAEVSGFVGHADGDGDQKMDYREFCALFPQVKDKREHIAKRVQEATLLINQAPQHLNRYQEHLQGWIQQLETLEEKIEIACGVKQIDDQLAAGGSYSYEKGHISEYEVQAMVKDIVRILQNIPDRNLGQDTARSGRRKSSRMSRDRARIAGPGVLGFSVLSRAARGSDSNPRRGDNQQRRCSSGSGGGSSSDAEAKVKKRTAGKTATEHWREMMEHERKQRLQRPDPSYTPELYLVDSLYWLVKVKSDFHWQRPFLVMARQLLDACVEDLIEVTIQKKLEWGKLVAVLDYQHRCREETSFGDVELMAGARLLPLGAFEGKNLRSISHIEKVCVKLPARCLFGHLREHTTRQMIEEMRELYMLSMRSAGKLIQQILQEVQELFLEVSEYFQMSGTMEAQMPSPPKISHEFLKHCEGRDLDFDAYTPRNDEEESDGEDIVRDFVGLPLGPDNSSDSQNFQHVQSYTEIRSCSEKAKRIERIGVLKTWSARK